MKKRARKIIPTVAASLILLALCLPSLAFFFFAPHAKAALINTNPDLNGHAGTYDVGSGNTTVTDPQNPNGGGDQGANGGGDQGSNGGGTVKLSNPLKGSDTLQAFLQNVLEGVVIPIGAVVAVLSIIYSGFLMVTARGNEDELKTAKAAFFMSVVGTAIILGAWVIAQAIQATVNQVVK